MTKETKDSLDYNLRMFDHHRNQSEGRKSWEITIKVQISKKSHDIGVLVLLEPNLKLRNVGMHVFWCTILSLSLIQLTLAHPHKDVLTEEEMNLPVDTILWIHIILQAAVWGVIFPIGMVLGITRSRWHVPLQVGADTLNLVKSSSNVFWYSLRDSC